MYLHIYIYIQLYTYIYIHTHSHLTGSRYHSHRVGLLIFDLVSTAVTTAVIAVATSFAVEILKKGAATSASERCLDLIRCGNG